MSLYAFGYAFLAVLGGIIVFAAGVKDAVVRFGEPLPASTAWFLAAGVAVYIGGLVWFRWLLGTGPLRARLALAAVVLPTALVGLTVSPEAQLGVLAAIVVAGVVVESAWQRRHGPPAAG
jgi:hypothetical protein